MLDISDRPLADLVSLRGRGAVVTGGARGIGRAISRRLAEAGAAVMIGDVDEVAAKSTADELAGELGSVVGGVGLDVTDSASISAVADVAVAELGRIDIWINNAGGYPMTPSLAMTDGQWDALLDLNLRGTFIGCREAARRMVADGKGGVIINMASVAGFNGGAPGGAHYVASKHGVRGITRALALEFADQGVRVLAVAPTGIVTPGMEELLAPAVAGTGATVDQLLATPLGRPGVPDDVARVVLFCATDLALFMTGSTVVVDAGALTIGR